MAKITFMTTEGYEIELDKKDVLFARMTEGNNSESTRLRLSEISDRADVVVIGTPEHINALVSEAASEEPKAEVSEPVIVPEETSPVEQETTQAAEAVVEADDANTAAEEATDAAEDAIVDAAEVAELKTGAAVVEAITPKAPKKPAAKKPAKKD